MTFSVTADQPEGRFHAMSTCLRYSRDRFAVDVLATRHVRRESLESRREVRIFDIPERMSGRVLSEHADGSDHLAKA